MKALPGRAGRLMAGRILAVALVALVPAGCGGDAGPVQTPTDAAAAPTTTTRATTATSEVGSTEPPATTAPPSTTSTTSAPSTTTVTSTTLWPFADPGPDVLDLGDGYLDGWLTSIEGTSFVVDTFTLRAIDGAESTFLMSADVDLVGFGSLTHFYQHEDYGWPIRVYFEEAEAIRTAIAIDDR